MLTLLVSLLCMTVAWAGLHFGVKWNAGAVVLAIFTGLLIQVLTTLWIRKRITTLMNAVQSRITERSTALRRKYEQLGSRGGSVKWLMDQARKDQDALMVESLDATRAMEPYCKWSLLLDRQVNAIRVQFLYQLRRFEEVDALLPRTMLGDPVLVCMKMCRHHKLGQEAETKKTYDKYRKKFKQEATLIYATYSWMLIRRKQVDEALKVLVAGKEATNDEVLEANWEHVANGRLGQFSNAALGEPWYALLLEEPKQPKPQMVRQQQRSGPFWRHR